MGTHINILHYFIPEKKHFLFQKMNGKLYQRYLEMKFSRLYNYLPLHILIVAVIKNSQNYLIVHNVISVSIQYNHT